METNSAASGLGKPPAANPVMDVVTPPPIEQTGQPKQASEADPVDKLAAADQAEQTAQASRQGLEKPKVNAAKTANPKHAAKTSGVNLAIIATVIIVLGLAVLATYAYLQTTK